MSRLWDWIEKKVDLILMHILVQISPARANFLLMLLSLTLLLAIIFYCYEIGGMAVSTTAIIIFTSMISIYIYGME